MSDSTLDPDNIPMGTDRVLGRGHGTRALGPSDNSDSGSDVVGEPDQGLDSDTDAEGTGERSGVDVDTLPEGADIGFDHVETIPVVDGEFNGDELGDELGDERGDELGEQRGDERGAFRNGERRDGARTLS